MRRLWPSVAPRWRTSVAEMTTSTELCSLELIALFPEEHVEGRKRPVTARDVLLQLDLVSVAQAVVTVDLLLEHAQSVAHHDDLVEERLDRDLFALEGRVGRLHDDRAALPLLAERGLAGEALFTNDIADEGTQGLGIHGVSVVA